MDIRTSPEKMKLKIHEPMNDEDFRAQEKGADRRRKRRNWRKKDDKDEHVQPEVPGVMRPLPAQVQDSVANSHSASQGEQDFIIDITTVDEGTTLPNSLSNSSSIPPLPSSIHTAPVSSYTPHTQPLLQREASLLVYLVPTLFYSSVRARQPPLDNSTRLIFLCLALQEKMTHPLKALCQQLLHLLCPLSQRIKIQRKIPLKSQCNLWR